MIYVFLADGFEEIEALTPVDILRRANLPLTTVSVTENRTVHGAHAIPVVADALLSEIDPANATLLLLPGGMPGTKNLAACAPLCKLITDHAAKGMPLAAICAAPSILGGLGLLRGKEAICYPGFESALEGAVLSAKRVVRDGNIVTAAGMGVALEFSLECLSLLNLPEVADKLRKAVIAD